MSITARDIITDAIIDLGRLAAGETPTAADVEFGLRCLNRFVDRCKADKLAIYSETRFTWTIVASQASYTVGAGGDVNIDRPVFIETVRWRDDSLPTPPEYPLKEMLDADWQRLAFKTLTAVYPSSYYYNATFPTGTLYLWPIPTNVNLSGVIYFKEAVQEFTNESTVISLPPGYRGMLIKNLVLEMAPAFNRQVDALMVQAAKETMATVLRANKGIVELRFPPDALVPTAERSYNIFIR